MMIRTVKSWEKSDLSFHLQGGVEEEGADEPGGDAVTRRGPGEEVSHHLETQETGVVGGGWQG